MAVRQNRFLPLATAASHLDSPGAPDGAVTEPKKVPAMSSPSDTNDAAANAMWGGRFAAGPAEIMEQINASIDFDRRLYAQDIRGSKAHADMLAKQGIIAAEDAAAIQDGLDRVLAEIEAGTFTFSRALEDIHMNVEARLKELIGEPAGRLHTGRSRNDQVATDIRLWLRDAIDGLDRNLAVLHEALISQAEAHADAVMPGYTHLQAAQPRHLRPPYAGLCRDGRPRTAAG